MELGAFPISLAVTDLEASRNSCEKLGFTDVRDLQRTLNALGVALLDEAVENTARSAGFIAVTRDGNPVLVDPHD